MHPGVDPALIPCQQIFLANMLPPEANPEEVPKEPDLSSALTIQVLRTVRFGPASSSILCS